jgi:hypothetical protein
MKKVLFLDIDDVLNDGSDFDSAYGEMKKGGSGECSGKFIIGKRFGNTPVSVEKINRLKSVVKESNCDIVGISSWFTLKKDHIEVSELFGINVMEVGYNTTGFGRYFGCLAWLNDHPDYTHAVILDDIPMNVEELFHIHVQPIGDGLTDELANDCINILKNPWKLS